MSMFRRRLMISNALGKSDGNINYPGLIAAWSAKGKANDDEDRAILKDLTGNGHDITLNGFEDEWKSGKGYNNPDYPDALVFDGVDDYGINEDMPILTDYTVICKRKHIEAKQYAALLSKFSINEIEGNGAFMFEIPSYSNNIKATQSFGANNNITTLPDEISWQTSESYNGNNISKGSNKDGKNITIGRLRNGIQSLSVVFYSAYLFDRSLDEQEIKAFIRKYIDADYLLPSEQ